MGTLKPRLSLPGGRCGVCFWIFWGLPLCAFPWRKLAFPLSPPEELGLTVPYYLDNRSQLIVEQDRLHDILRKGRHPAIQEETNKAGLALCYAAGIWPIIKSRGQTGGQRARLSQSEEIE